MKTCSKCRTSRPLDDFIPDNRRKDGRGSWCRPCHRAIQVLPRRVSSCIVCGKGIEGGRSDKKYCGDECGSLYRQRKYSLKRYGLTPEAYFELLATQDWKCAICSKEETSTKRLLAVDHDHATGEIRGILCHRCNTALGLFRDDVGLLRAAERYLNE